MGRVHDNVKRWTVERVTHLPSYSRFKCPGNYRLRVDPRAFQSMSGEKEYANLPPACVGNHDSSNYRLPILCSQEQRPVEDNPAETNPP